MPFRVLALLSPPGHAKIGLDLQSVVYSQTGTQIEHTHVRMDRHLAGYKLCEPCTLLSGLRVECLFGVSIQLRFSWEKKLKCE